MEFFRQTNFNFLRWQWYFIGASWVLILAGVVSLWTKGGPRYGIDFKGGTLVRLKFAERPDLERIRAGLARNGLGGSTIQRSELPGQAASNEIFIGVEQRGNEEEALDTTRQAIVAALRQTYSVASDGPDLNNVGAAALAETLQRADPLGLAAKPSEAAGRYRDIAERITEFRDNERGGLLRSLDELRGVEGVPPAVVIALPQQYTLSPFVVRNAEAVGPKVGRQLRQQALLATSLALAGMLVYIGWRFPEWIYGVGATVATLHDVLITVGLLSIFNYEFDLNVVAALLTLVGYSVNDTIVVFDRIRENVRLLRSESFLALVNRSINQTLSRTVLTSGLTFLTVLALFFLGGEVLHGLAFTLAVGIVVGTYSSIFIASPIVVGWMTRGRGSNGSASRGSGPTASAAGAGRKGK
jgi:preprotein translocase subunit SecF